MKKRFPTLAQRQEQRKALAIVKETLFMNNYCLFETG
jgi:hypothetical protein